MKALQTSKKAMHGRAGDSKWAPPLMAVECDEDARPNYNTCKAHEYLDQPDVLAAKVTMLANLIWNSSNFVAYTGAGISTAAGVPDYATKAKQSLIGKVDTGGSLDKAPTYGHRALVALYRAGHLKHWVQQNHDGLPQKAGFPQECINEIHGAWFDPSNPVVPMSGTLRDDLVEWMHEWEQKADLCLAMGSSLCGMNADRMVQTPAKKAKKGAAHGSVIVSLQQTQLDEDSTLRIFAKIDDVMRLLAEEMHLDVDPMDTPYIPPTLKPKQLEANVFHNLPYNSDGILDPLGKLTLDLRLGAKVRLVNQPDWDQQRLGTNQATISKKQNGSYLVDFGIRKRMLGLWMIEAAARGAIPRLPLVNV
eukprot:c25880_g1_i1.p1 GENE.c25880_g1_i1~~c25880_g1_i1.p1  ORF type:complete len:363 (+),score=67.50 c25880_g1_i1:84-1172(+)